MANKTFGYIYFIGSPLNAACFTGQHELTRTVEVSHNDDASVVDNSVAAVSIDTMGIYLYRVGQIKRSYSFQ